MISLKKVYRALKPNNLRFINYENVYKKDGAKAIISFHQNADFKQVVSIQAGTIWYANHSPISSVYDSFYFDEHFLIKKIFN